MSVRALRWNDDHLSLLDQRLLPTREVWVDLASPGDVVRAIRDMVVRGAPAIGITAAYGMVLALKVGHDLGSAANDLKASRPTAVNLFWVVDRMLAVVPRTFEAFLQEAKHIEGEDVEANKRIGHFGASLVPERARILTICNTGGLATGGHGTALGIIRTAYQLGKVEHVYSCETRPRQQGLRLTAWELTQDGIPFSSIADGAAASLMAVGKVDWVVAGADRIAANGDSANKIGTYALAVLARYHEIPFIIAAPSSTLDRTLADGTGIPIEERAAEELTEVEGVRIAPANCPVYNPGFDVTPASLIDAIVTETGVHRRPYRFSS